MALSGSALERGRQQALQRPDLVLQVRNAVHDRLRNIEVALARPQAQALLHEQGEFLRLHDPEGFDESLGISQGYGIVHDDLLAYLHGNVVSDLAAEARRAEADGCTAWAKAHDGACVGARVVKNRDYRGEHGRLQYVFLHRDPAWGGRSMLCLGSLGSPGAFSSGMNSDGLVLVDTQISTRDHGVGWLRYFLMTALLRGCSDVPQALAMVQTVPHAGGGSLVLGDREGQVASVELGHRQAPAVVRSNRSVAHTNHFLDSAHAPWFLKTSDDLNDSSHGRLACIEAALAVSVEQLTLAKTQALMASHGSPGSVCRHADGRSSGTLSCAIYDTADLSLTVSHGPPCEGKWAAFGLDGPLGKGGIA